MMSIQSFKEYLNFLIEEPIGVKDLFKNLGGVPMGPLKNFIAQIERGEPFLTTGNWKDEKVYLENDPKLIKILSNATRFEDIPKTKGNMISFQIRGTNERIPMSKLLKTAAFGSSSGSGGGSDATDVRESGQCVYCALAFDILRQPLTPKNMTEDGFSKAMSFSKIKFNKEKALDLSEKWTKSSILSANQLLHYFNGGHFNFHRDSSLTKHIDKTFKRINKISGDIFGNMNKWNPADIWMASPDVENIKFDKHTTFEEWNAELLHLYHTKKLVGISLKLVKKFAKIAEYNITKESPPKRWGFFEGYIIQSPQGNFFSSKDAYLLLGNGGKMQFRTFSDLARWQGQITGKVASGGKVSYGTIDRIVSSATGQKFTPREIVSALAKKPTDKFISDMFKMYQKTNTSSKKLTKEEFAAGVKQSRPDWLYSKYLVLQLVYHLVSYKSQADQIVSDIVAYAASATEQSAPYIKCWQA